MNKVLIGIPSRGSISVGTANFLLANKDKDSFFGCSSLSVECARLQIVSYFLEGDYTHLFFLDDDVKPDNDCIDKLLVHNKDMICSPYPIMQGGRILSCCYGFDKKLQDMLSHIEGPEEIHSCGLGACLIKREVLNLTKPAFDARSMFEMRYNERGIMIRTDDITFCEAVTKTGYKIYTDFNIPSIHCKQINLNAI